MGKLWSSIKKELTLLRRDFAGLMVLFVMPVVLVIVVTLVQENVLKSMGETDAKVIFVDRDGGPVAASIEGSLRESGSVKVVKEIKGRQADLETAKKVVSKGDFQFCVIVPEGMTEKVKRRAKEAVKASLLVGNVKPKQKAPEEQGTPGLMIYFDPALREPFRTGVVKGLEKMMLAIEIKTKMEILSEILPDEMEKIARKALGPAWSEEFKAEIPRVRIAFDNKPLVEIRGETARYGRTDRAPNTVQQNVPAWTLFGMFFTVVPLATSLIRERRDGVVARLLTMPISYGTIISGKIMAYVIICLVQFVLIMAVGTSLLPLLGAPALDMGSSLPALLLITLSSALAATGYGILLGTIAGTYEQASMFGAVSVVVAAALGGVMVPTYVMPEIMQQISLFSPLAWGLNGFLNIFARGGGVMSVLPEAALMMGFFCVTTLMAHFYGAYTNRIRIQ